eukprot:4943421-Pyramimonas_sp.AAC.1
MAEDNQAFSVELIRSVCPVEQYLISQIACTIFVKDWYNNWYALHRMWHERSCMTLHNNTPNDRMHRMMAPLS